MNFMVFRKYKGPIFLFIFCLIAYLPLSTFLFALKNDAFIYNFPNKYFFSEALKNGYSPAWNPYLNFGFPLYADPGFAWWQPITWFFGIIGYNAYTFTIEVLLYIFLAGLGMYNLGRSFNFHKKTSFLLGCIFMCCGFFIGNLQHINFLTCAAFLPWAISYWFSAQNNPSLKNLSLSGIAVFLLCAGGHPAIPIAFFYYIIIITSLYFFYKKGITNLKNYVIIQLKLGGIILLFLSPLLISYLQIIPYYTRSESVNQFESVNVGFTLPSYISFLLPFATVKNYNWFGTDISMRNAYFTLSGFILFLVILYKHKKLPPELLVLLFAGMFMLVLSAGGTTKSILYENLPGLNYIRTNGEFRVFSIFSFITCSGFLFNSFLINENTLLPVLKKSFKWIAIISFILSVSLITFLVEIPLLWENDGNLADNLKYVIDHLSFMQSWFIAILTLFFTSLMYLLALQNKETANGFIICTLADVLINSWMLLPFTGVGKTSVSTIQSIIDKSPSNIPIPSIKPGAKESEVSKEEEKIIGNWSWFDKEIMHKPIDYPSQLKSTNLFLTSTEREIISSQPFLFTTKNKHVPLHVERFSPCNLKVSLKAVEPDTLVYLQNNFPGWKVKVNNTEAHVITFSKTFLSVPVYSTTQTIEFYFSPFFK